MKYRFKIGFRKRARKNARPDLNRWINELIDAFFTAFNDRQIPHDRFVSKTYEDQRLESILRNVDRREITHEFIKEMDLYPDDWMAFMTNEGRLHYLPVVMSLSVQEVLQFESRYGVLTESILGLLSPWRYFFSPHAWVVLNEHIAKRPRLFRFHTDSLTLADWLFDEDSYLQSEKGNLVLSLTGKEKKALIRYVTADIDTCSHYPLFIYGICETLEGRIDVGDGYSWLPKHEKKLLLDFIDSHTTDNRDELSGTDMELLRRVRQSIEPD